MQICLWRCQFVEALASANPSTFNSVSGRIIVRTAIVLDLFIITRLWNEGLRPVVYIIVFLIFSETQLKLLKLSLLTYSSTSQIRNKILLCNCVSQSSCSRCSSWDTKSCNLTSNSPSYHSNKISLYCPFNDSWNCITAVPNHFLDPIISRRVSRTLYFISPI